MSVSHSLKDYIEAVAERNGYPSSAELVREAVLFRLAWLEITENRETIEAVEEMCRRLLRDEPGR